MGTLADSLFTVLMGWVRGLVSGIWALFTSDNTTVLEFLGRNWAAIAAVIIGAGLVIDWVIWLLRWQPYHLWAQRARRILRIEEPEEEVKKLRARPAVTKKRAQEAPVMAQDEQNDELIREEDEVFARAHSVPDRELGAYPGMLYDRENPQPEVAHAGTQRYSVLSQGGPGAAEVERRRAEIDEYRRMQEEAAQRAREEAAMRAEQERIAREEAARQAAEQAERERMAAEQAAAQAEDEAAQLAQQQYERELAEYERQRVQYERELAEYERQKAAYDAQIATQAAQSAEKETAAAPADSVPRRRRARNAAYSAYVPGEDVSELPDPPVWPQMDTARIPAVRETDAGQTDGAAPGGILGRMAGMLAPQEEDEIAGIRSLPPRVDMREAYKPAKPPKKTNHTGAEKLWP